MIEFKEVLVDQEFGFTRDMLLAERVKAQVQSRGLTVYEVDGSRSVEEMATLIEQHFKPFLHKPGDIVA